MEQTLKRRWGGGGGGCFLALKNIKVEHLKPFKL